MSIPTSIPSTIPTSDTTILEADGMVSNVRLEEGALTVTVVGTADGMVSNVKLEEARLFKFLQSDGMVASVTLEEGDLTQHASLTADDLSVRAALEEAVLTQHHDLTADGMLTAVKLEEVGFSVIPARPDNFEAERTNSFQDTDLSWDAVPGADEYVISRSEHYRERYVELARVQSGTTTYTDNHGNPDQRYSYRIYAVHLYGGKSPRSPAVHTKASSSEL